MRIFETVLYASDLDAAARFYTEVLGLTLLNRTESFLVFRTRHGALLIFDPDKSAAAGRQVPSHGARGEGHAAFAMPAHEVERWRARLTEHGVEIESEVAWSEGGRSIYFRDPAGNSLELAPSTLWGGDWGF